MVKINTRKKEEKKKESLEQTNERKIRLNEWRK